jgi:tetratricopeptide (TPR) repeat protein
MKRVVSLMLLGTLFLVAGCRHSYDLTRGANQLDFGVQAARMNLWREALFRFERAVKLNPEDAMARNNLAVAYEGIGEFDKARAAYLEALRLDKSNQYIQKNYSRFTEFVSKNRKREKKAATSASSPPAAAPVTPPVTAPPAGKPEPMPPTNPASNPPSTTPPATPPTRPATDGGAL